MHTPDFYNGLDKDGIAEKVREEGFDPIYFSDPAGNMYSPHKHPETKLLAFVRGDMEVVVNGETFQCKAGDKLIIPGNTEHKAVVGPRGCDFFWSEKMM